MADEECSLNGAAVGVDEILTENLLVDPADDSFVFIIPLREIKAGCMDHQIWFASNAALSDFIKSNE